MDRRPAMRGLVILAHPRRDSLCGALFEAYANGARQAGSGLPRVDPERAALPARGMPGARRGTA